VGVAAVVEGFGIVGPERDRPLQARERILEAGESLERNATVVMRKGGIGVQLQGGVDMTHCLCMFTALVISDPQQVQAVEMIGLRLQNLPVYRFGLCEPARPMQRDCFLECRVACGRT
jgi:hypothetical protein